MVHLMNTPESFREQPASRVILPSSQNLPLGLSCHLQRICLPGYLAIFREFAWRNKSKSSDFREIERNKAIDRGVHFRSRNIGVFTHIRASTSSEPAVVDLQSADCSRYSFEQINTHDRFTEECLTFWLILSDSDRSHILGLLLRTGK